jgi:hypothetical protein
MTSQILSQPAEDSRAMLERHNDRAHFWRLVLGMLGLFWVCVLILLMR